MKFVDQASVQVYAGAGGAGSMHMRREKFVPKGGPDGGNGGKGGNVIFKASETLNTLIDYNYAPIIKAGYGTSGDVNLMTGADGSDKICLLPIGTQVFFGDKLVADLSKPGAIWLAAKGGRGGKGNAHFKNSQRQAPDFAQSGEPGEAFEFRLELKSVADVGLVGLPNAGKSSLISVISEAKPKIASYPFTTLRPSLGVVSLNVNARFVVADIPGLIPEAHKGKGLGIQFLKHIERTSVLAHLVDSSAYPTLEFDEQVAKVREDIKKIEIELEAFSPELMTRPRVLVFTKSDVDEVNEIYETLKNEYDHLNVFLISSATNSGLEELKNMLYQLVSTPKEYLRLAS